MLELKASEVTFHREGRLILDQVNLDLTEGKHYCLVGPNGSGKTTLLSLLAGVEWPSSGAITLSDTRGVVHAAHARSRFGVFFPRSVAALEAYHPGITALEVVCTGMQHTMGLYTEPTEEQINRARSILLQYVHSIPETSPFSSMSTGERFRLLLLRSIVDSPDVLILDEPFDGLDLPGRDSFEKLIRQTIVSHTRLTLSVLHRIEEIPPFVTDIILLKEGRILAAGSAAEILTDHWLSTLFDMKLVCRQSGSRYYVLHGD